MTNHLDIVDIVISSVLCCLYPRKSTYMINKIKPILGVNKNVGL